jgi:hypothetical protein
MAMVVGLEERELGTCRGSHTATRARGERQAGEAKHSRENENKSQSKGERASLEL